MAYELKIEKFEGPLALLLKLVEQEDLEITEISLAKVTEDYLNYLEELEKTGQIAYEEVADFLVIAAKLLYIKSKSLLPELAQQEESDGLNLEDQLKMYKEFIEAAKKIEQRIKNKKFSYFRLVPWKQLETGFAPPRSVTADKMKKIFEDVLERLKPVVELPKDIIERTVTIKEKIQEIQDLFVSINKASFHELLGTVKHKTEIIVTFLAILELTKQREIMIFQENNFENISIEKL